MEGNKVESAPASCIVSSRVLNKCLSRKASNRGRKGKKVVRKILLNPFVPYWPALNEEQNILLSKAIKRIIDGENPCQNDKERLQKRKKWRECFVYGINEVPRSVQNGNIWAVLVADDVDPKFLVEHTVYLCGTAGICVLIVSSIRHYTKELLGFSSIALGIKKAARTHEKTLELCHLIEKLSVEYKPPHFIEQFNKKTVELYKTNETSEPIVEKVKEKVEDEEMDVDITATADVYLYRTSNSGSAFVPPPRFVIKEEKPQEVTETNKIVHKQDLSDFVPLGIDSNTENESDNDISQPKGVSYKLVNSSPNQKKRKAKTKESNTPKYVPFNYIQVVPNPEKKGRKRKKKKMKEKN